MPGTTHHCPPPGDLAREIAGLTTRGRLVRIAGGLAAVLAVAACDTGKVSALPLTGTTRDSAEQVMYGGRSVLASNGLRRGEIAGDTVMSFAAATRFEFQGLRASFVSPLGGPLGTLTAPTGTYRVPGGAFDAHGAVTITSDTTHRRIEGAAVHYDPAKNQLSSDSAFVATSGTRRLTGIGFTADPGLFSVKCAQRCSGSLGP